jgi:myb proto-oncogene protein
MLAPLFSDTSLLAPFCVQFLINGKRLTAEEMAEEAARAVREAEEAAAAAEAAAREAEAAEKEAIALERAAAQATGR